jgi:hypothetical protein
MLKESPPQRCDICHQTDLFDRENLICRRCADVDKSLTIDKKSVAPMRFMTLTAQTRSAPGLINSLIGQSNDLVLNFDWDRFIEWIVQGSVDSIRSIFSYYALMTALFWISIMLTAIVGFFDFVFLILLLAYPIVLESILYFSVLFIVTLALFKITSLFWRELERAS